MKKKSLVQVDDIANNLKVNINHTPYLHTSGMKMANLNIQNKMLELKLMISLI
ncbi:MAG: hypothetical protein J6P12_10610 [Methanobrevibacter sp.]|nr:hypothetical protein [Methanobrevibacter sp.]